MSNAAIEELKFKLFEEEIKFRIQQAYEQGVEDGRKKYAVDDVMTRTEAMKYLKCKPTKMAELLARPDFPVNREFGVKIPTVMLQQWIYRNTSWVEKNTNYYSKEAI
ncbi:hypothetical protein [Cytobacillus horneckiae]|uniref:hypothetical protein n=1 Tax=Cytobacillus horneckiae TaxID=549687 RepID=UPI003D9A2A20